MKSYHEQNYPVSINVSVTFSLFDEDDTFEDSIKGLNEGHALYLARLNWPDAVIIEII